MTTSRGVCECQLVLIAYLACPIDLVPDFLPVIGYADDVILVIAMFRLAVRRAGVETLERLWPGTDDGLETLMKFAGIPARSIPGPDWIEAAKQISRGLYN